MIKQTERLTGLRKYDHTFWLDVWYKLSSYHNIPESIKLQLNCTKGGHRLQLPIMNKLIYYKISLFHKITNSKLKRKTDQFKMGSNFELLLVWENMTMINWTQKIQPFERLQRLGIFQSKEERVTKFFLKETILGGQGLFY